MLQLVHTVGDEHVAQLLGHVCPYTAIASRLVVNIIISARGVACFTILIFTLYYYNIYYNIKTLHYILVMVIHIILTSLLVYLCPFK